MANDDSLAPDLAQLRAQIDAIDRQVLGLLNRRAKIAQEVGESKRKNGVPVFRPEREAQVMQGLARENAGPLSPESVAAIYREVISACRALERSTRVAFLGPLGTFSEQAATRQFGTSVELVPCASFDEVFRKAETGDVDFGVVPVENSTEGAVSRNLDLLLQTPLSIAAEVELKIEHHLLTRSGNMSGVRRICAQSQALAQSARWLDSHHPNLERVAVASNAEAAHLAATDDTIAAIAGEIAARRYGLSMVASQIQDESQNTTRFAVLGKSDSQASGADRTSIILSVPNQAGAVHDMLVPLKKHGVSMTRFESRPARTGVWTYYFYIDIEGHRSDARVAAALAELALVAGFCKILGSYPVGRL